MNCSLGDEKIVLQTVCFAYSIVVVVVVIVVAVVFHFLCY